MRGLLEKKRIHLVKNIFTWLKKLFFYNILISLKIDFVPIWLVDLVDWAENG